MDFVIAVTLDTIPTTSYSGLLRLKDLKKHGLRTLRPPFGGTLDVEVALSQTCGHRAVVSWGTLGGSAVVVLTGRPLFFGDGYFCAYRADKCTTYIGLFGGPG